MMALHTENDTERADLIWRHPVYQEHFRNLQDAERTREFCRHTLMHFLDVARIAHILNLENSYGIPKDIVYAAALLHDIGRSLQFSAGTPHDQASASLCTQIMPDCGFSGSEISRVQSAILHHRGHDLPEALQDQHTKDPLAECLKRADKLSRNCFDCPAAHSCNWPCEKRNHSIFI